MDTRVEEILKNFDFEKVRKAMLALDWCYGSDTEVPTIGELFFLAKELLEKTLENRYSSISTGGFKATLSTDGFLSLEFIIADWNVDNEGVCY